MSSPRSFHARPYKIGDLSRLLSLPPSAIRYYEEQGMVSPDKDWQTLYRHYHPADGCRILAAKTYRSMGFSVEECRRLIAESDQQAIERGLTNRLGAIDAEIARLNALRKSVAQVQARVSQIPHDVGRVRDLVRPGYYRIGGGQNNLIDLDDGQVRVARRWLSFLPATLPSFAIPQGFFTGREPFSYTWGYALAEDDFRFYGESFGPPMEYHPPAACLYSVVAKDDIEDFQPGHFQVLRDALSAGGLSCVGPGLGSTLGIAHEEGREIVRFGITVPIIDNSEVNS